MEELILRQTTQLHLHNSYVYNKTFNKYQLDLLAPL